MNVFRDQNVCIYKEQRGPCVRKKPARRYQIYQDKTAKNESKHDAIALHLTLCVQRRKLAQTDWEYDAMALLNTSEVLRYYLLIHRRERKVSQSTPKKL